MSINSISSVDAKEELNENINIKKEIDVLNNVLSNNDAANLFNLLLQFKKYLRRRNKTEDMLRTIKIKRIDIKNIIDKFFDILLSELSIHEIKIEQAHLDIY